MSGVRLTTCQDVSELLHLIEHRACDKRTAALISLQGSMEGVKLSQCDFVAVAHGVYAEHCLQMNVNNSHINATHCCIYACNVNQSSFSNLLLYKVAAFPVSCSCRCHVRRRSDSCTTVHAALRGEQTVLMALVRVMTIWLCRLQTDESCAGVGIQVTRLLLTP